MIVRKIIFPQFKMNLEQLDTNYLISIFLEHSLPEISQYCQVSKRFNEICNNDLLWHQKYIKDFGPASLSQETWKQKYTNRVAPNLNAYTLVSVQYKRHQMETTVYGTVVANDEQEVWNLIAFMWNNRIKNDLTVLISELIDENEYYGGTAKSEIHNINGNDIEVLIQEQNNETNIYTLEQNKLYTS